MQRLNVVARRYMLIITIMAISIYTVFWSLYITMFHPVSDLREHSNRVESPPIVRLRPLKENDALKNSAKKSKPSNSTLGFDRIYITDVSNRPGRREKL